MPTSPTAISGPRASGFTLIELLVAMGVMAILVAVAAPSFRDTIMGVRMSAQVNDMMADLALARSEAIKRNRTVILCPSPAPHTNCAGTNWANGWMVFVDEDGDNIWDNNFAERAIKSREAIKVCATCSIATGNIPTSGGVAYLRYRPTGISQTAATVQIFQFCDGRNNNRGRRIEISPTGRPVARRFNC
jgi:type IV fimbrial biogenesis protein FimT